MVNEPGDAESYQTPEIINHRITVLGCREDRAVAGESVTTECAGATAQAEIELLSG
jgi:hypothetical protein